MMNKFNKIYDMWRMAFPLVILSLALICPSQMRAQTKTVHAFTIEDPSLSTLPKAIVLTVKEDSSYACFRSLKCSLKGRKAALTNRRNSYIITTANACGWGAAQAPIWIVSRENGIFRMLLHADGYKIMVKSVSHQGFKDIRVNVATAGHQSSKLYIFNEKKYVIHEQ